MRCDGNGKEETLTVSAKQRQHRITKNNENSPFSFPIGEADPTPTSQIKFALGCCLSKNTILQQDIERKIKWNFNQL